MGERIFGAKGGGQQQSSRTPVEAPDSLQSIATARVLMLMGLGQFAGPAGDLLQSIYLDGVPLKNADGTLNFERVTAEWRAGTQNQDRIEGFSEIETEYGVSVEVKTTAAATRQIDDLDADAVRVTVSVPALVAADASNGDTNPTSVQMGIDLKPAIGSWQQVKTVHINGKTRSKYQRSVRIPLTGDGPWQLRVRRITADSSTQNLQNATVWDSYTVINEAPLRYPNYALLALRFDAKAFSSFPKIEVRWRLAILQVPSNYDPATRSYSGPWDGTFKPTWSDNPAWWLWAYATDKRYNVNIPPGAWKWDLYRIAQWCDQRVSDGQGGTRPRFTCNVIQSESVDAWKVLQDIASAFCGRVVPYAGGVRVTADIPGDVPAKHFMPTNVKDGRFAYSSTELADRQTVAVVSFIDPDDGDKRATEYVEHAEGLTVYGYQPAEVAAVGCTSRAQAQQLGRYILETAQSETEMVSFGTGTYGMDLMPGELFYLSDPAVAGGRFGGRLLAVDGVNVTLDAPVTLAAGVSYSLEVPMPDGTLVRRGVTSGVGSTAAIVLAAPYPAQPVEGTTWLLVATNVEPTLWRCVRNAESKESPGEREISGVQHDPNKWARIEQGIRIDPPPVSLLPDPGRIDAVSVVDVREVSYLRPDGTRAVRLDVDWPALSHSYLRGYVVGIRQAGGDWRELPEQSANHAEIPDIAPGDWQVRVAAVSVTGLRSIPTVSDIAAEGHTAPPPAPGFTATGGAMRVDFTITWPSPDCVRAELYGSGSAGDPNPAKLTDLAYPTTTWAQLGVSTGVTLYYWLRVIDTWDNVSAFATASATTVKDPSILLQQLQGSVSRDALDGLLRTDIVTAQDMATRVIPALNEANEQAAKAGIAALIEADRRRREARFNRRAFDAIIDVDPATGKILLKATAEITTDVDAKLRDVQLVLDAQAGQLATAVSGVSSQGGRLTAAESKLTQLESGISLAVQQAFAYTDGAVASNGDAVDSLQQQVDTLAGSGIASLLADQRRQQQARAVRLGLARAEFDIKAVADGLAAEATARLSLAAQLGDAAAALVVEQQARAAGDAAVSLSVSSLQTTVGGHTAAIQEQAQSVDGLKAQKTLRVTAGGKIAGWAAYADANASAFDVLADVFRISLPNGSGSRQVFTVGSLNGGPAVGIAGDLILDGAMSARHIAAEAANFVLLQAKSVWAQTGYIGALSELTANAGIVISGRLQNGATLATSTAVIDLNARGSQPFLQVINKDTGRQDVLVTADGYVQVARQVVSEPDIRAARVDSVDSGFINPGGTWTYMVDTGYQAAASWTEAPSEQLVGGATISGGQSQGGGGTGVIQVDVLYGDGLSGGGGGYLDSRVYLKITYMHAGTGPIRITQLKWKLARV